MLLLLLLLSQCSVLRFQLVKVNERSCLSGDHTQAFATSRDVAGITMTT